MLDLDAASAASPSPSLAPAPRVLNVHFTGSGSEYFRIWAVNLLLILVTLGLYLPFAKARRIRYFYANTLVDGQALSFHGDAWKMFRGFVVLLVLAGLYFGFNAVSPTLGALAFVALALMWPPLWRAGMRFRLSHTSWRGLRFGFAGDVPGAYQAFLPALIPLGIVMLVPEDATGMWLVLLGFAGLALNLMMLWTLGLVKCYQHRNYRFAHLQTRTSLEPSAVFGLGLRLGFVGGAVIGIAAVVGAVMVGLAREGGNWLGFIGVVLVAVLAYTWLHCAFSAGLQNMAWSRTTAEGVRIQCDLQTMDLLKLTLKNWLLMAVTLGLYRPFAAVATARLRLEAVSLEASVDVDALVGDEAAQHTSAAGDFAGDFFGIDLGL
ncbi:MAG TPA: YjgN family protein [Roseateles sp.]